MICRRLMYNCLHGTAPRYLAKCDSACCWSNVAPSTAIWIVIRSCGARNTSFITWRQSLCSCWTKRMEQLTSVRHRLLITSHLKKYLKTYTCSAYLFTARCTIVQSAVLRLHVVRLSVYPSETLITVDGSWPRSFSVAGPLAWNSLSPEIKTTSLTLGQFSGRLKTEMYIRSYYASAQPS